MSKHPSMATCFSLRMLRVYKKEARLNSIRRQVTRAHHEIHVLHTELFHEKHGKACSRFYI